ncbi:hypothetical protein EDC55_12013 [Allofrancisella inopinata]|uniref:Uncharacterized protein n=1 Tax=Allofrancisella inopinata TaxID=1085647 RepID=A0AAE6YKH2_9GAMM|nr:hypothetical protein [Allofrancisella inopinata]QIV96507.1 hypothetical protein E4K63_06555 [Allofrancisella inopinata]TDT68498.1 hypothetical protein EDC55_12013 [Allofrancisella inopinata]
MSYSVREAKPKNINRLLIVGHEMSNYETVESLLNQSGMKEAEALKKERINAKDVSSIIKKANNIDEQSYDRLDVNPIWNGLAMDLMISNMNNKLWGWSDPQAISLLEYWKSADPNLGFVLVYNSPQSFVKRLFDSVDNISNEVLQDKISDYIEYNEALLQFFYQNIEESVLVSSEQVGHNAKEYIEQLESQLSLVNISSTNAVVNVLDMEGMGSGGDEVSDYLIEQLIKKNTQLVDMFDELQSVAVLPQGYADHGNNDDQEFIVNALIKRSNDIKVVKNLEMKCQQNEKQLQALNVENSSIKEQRNNIGMKLKQASDENELLMGSLFQVREELERLYGDKNAAKSQFQSLEKQKNDIEKRLNNVVEQTKLLTEQNKKIDEAKKNLDIEYKQKISQLEQKFKQQNNVLGSKNKLEKNVRKLEEENNLLLSQLFNVQEELEKAYLLNSKLGAKESKRQLQYGAAERVRGYLSYRLGIVMMENYNSLFGLIKMPLKLLLEVKKFKKDQKNKPKLPPLHTYADYYKAERVKNHLTYHLGNEIMHCFRTPLGLVKWPFAVRKAFKKYAKGKA